MLLSLLSKRSLEVDSRDSYGFALRPQYAQRYREYSSIYKEEEGERSEKWRSFLAEAPKSTKPNSPEKKYKETLEVEGNDDIKEERNSNSVCKEEDSSNQNISEGTTIKEEIDASGVSEGGDSSARNLLGVTQIQEGTSPRTVCERDDLGSKKVTFDNSIENNSEKVEERKTRKVQRWAETRPSLSAIEKMMSSRVKKGSDMKGERRAGLKNVLEDEDSLQQFSLWKELEFLVQGGVPKDLRGEVWQAFVGVKTRRVKSYYEDLLAQETIFAESNEQHEPSTTASGKWKKQIEKDITRTFPGHPALDERGRNSLRRVLLAYARHNPSVGYCQVIGVN
ncbi:hypothetical protein PIB30_048835 [Stylosanthes scabra]|uniref:Rab-GAP TBC domain-containing protein n=1 Tax=Stylosanthes scabra TaxID=79078 RepID=A0ABU6TGW7_9FABA|nr:hypothetical protein [Stylosanthes scabra]